MITNDIEECLNRQPPYDNATADKLIAHYREQRARAAAGEKAIKESGPKAVKLDLNKLGLSKKPAAAPAGPKLTFG